MFKEVSTFYPFKTKSKRIIFNKHVKLVDFFFKSLLLEKDLILIFIFQISEKDRGQLTIIVNTKSIIAKTVIFALYISTSLYNNCKVILDAPSALEKKKEKRKKNYGSFDLRKKVSHDKVGWLMQCRIAKMNKS